MTLALVSVAVSLVCAGLLWTWTRSTSGPAGASEETPNRVPGRWTFALRVEGEDAVFARSILERGASEEDRLVDFMRLVPSATHFYGGEWTPSLRCDLPSGVLVRVDASHETGATEDLAQVLTLLRGLGVGANPKLSLVESNPEGQPLRAVDEAQRPGHRQCTYCQHSFVLHELTCPSCGAAVESLE